MSSFCLVYAGIGKRLKSGAVCWILVEMTHLCTFLYVHFNISFQDTEFKVQSLSDAKYFLK